MFGQFTSKRLNNSVYGDMIGQSVKPSLYKLNPIQTTNCDTHVNSDRIHIDSLLRGFEMPSLTVDKCGKFGNLDHIRQPQFKPQVPEPAREGRLYDSARDIRESFSSRLDHPFHININVNEPRPVDTRRIAKDNHRAIWDAPLEKSKFKPMY